MIKQKTIWLQYPDDDIIPADFANVFESNSLGIIIPGGFYTETDVNGQMQYDDTLPIAYITAQWQGNKLTLPFSQFKSMQNIAIEIKNELDGVVITAEKPDNTLLWIILGFTAAKALRII